jgi:hypothetical protein
LHNLQKLEKLTLKDIEGNGSTKAKMMSLGTSIPSSLTAIKFRFGTSLINTRELKLFFQNCAAHIQSLTLLTKIADKHLYAILNHPKCAIQELRIVENHELSYRAVQYAKSKIRLLS